MTKPANYVPKLRHHKAKGLAYVCFSGRAIYLGKWGTPDAQARYDKLIAEWLDRGRVPPIKPGSTDTYRVDDLVADYFANLERRFPGSRELERVSYALKKMVAMFGEVPAADVSLPMLREFRDTLIQADLCRNEVNKRTAQIKRMFKWGARYGKVPMSAHQEISLIETVRRGELNVRDSPKVTPVTRTHVDAVLPHVSSQVRAMIELQWHTGMRPGEVVLMRKCDMTMEGNQWRYRPSQHKNLHRGFERVVPIPTVVRGLLQSFLLRPEEAFLFTPGEAEAERRKRQHARRQTPVQPSQEARHQRSMKTPKQEFGPRYTTESYGLAIARGCKAARIPRWSPNRLRHAAASRIAEKCGLHAARAILGHRSVQTTAIYAKADLLSAESYLEQMG
jgi:integrase